MKNTCAYALKAIAACLVVMAHCMFPGRLGAYEKMLAHFTVPLFFMYSGYFIAHKPASDVARCAGRIAKLALAVQLVYVAGYLLIRFFYGVETWPRLSVWFAPDAMFAWVGLNRPPVGAHLWYLYALVYCYGALWLLRRRGLAERVYWLIPALLGAQLALDAGLAAFGVILHNFIVRNFAFIGLPFFLLGALIRNRQAQILSRHWASSRRLSLFALLGLALLPLERRISGSTCEFYLSSILISVSLMLLSLRHAKAFAGTVLAEVGQHHSLFIYLYHNMVLALLRCAAFGLGIEEELAFQYALPPLTVLLTTGLSYLARGIQLRFRPAPNTMQQA